MATVSSPDPTAAGTTCQAFRQEAGTRQMPIFPTSSQDSLRDTSSNAAASSNPFFLTFAPYLVHVPLEAPAPLVSKYTMKIADLDSQAVDLQGHDNATYAAMIEKMDQALGRVLDRLDDPDGNGDDSDSIRSNTIVMFASDNGGLTVSELGYPRATSVTPLREGKGSLYEGGIRTPFITSWTGNSQIPQGSTTATRVSSYDIYPTLLDMTGLTGNAAVPRNSDIDGVSFAPALEGATLDRGYQIWHMPHRSNQDQHRRARHPVRRGGVCQCHSR